MPLTVMPAKLGASFTELTKTVFVTTRLVSAPSFTATVTVRAEVFGTSEVFR